MKVPVKPVPAQAVPAKAVTPRERHRLQTREEILDAAVAVMTELGVAALNLTEVARRVGLRQPSLYQYFDSRTAVYDALFERGMQTHAAVIAAAIDASVPGWAAVRAACRETLRFASEQPALAQLLFSRVVPGFVPSAPAYAPSLRSAVLMHAAMTAAVDRGELHPSAATERGVAMLLAVVAGFGSQHQANEPDTTFADSPLIALLEPALDMYAAYFCPARPPGWTPWLRASQGRGSGVPVTGRGTPLL